MDSKLPFGLKNNQLIHILDVESGLNCACSCPGCGHQLIARKGDVRMPHFAHYKHSDCQHGYETAIHLAAKEVIEKSGYIVLPRYVSPALHFKNFRHLTLVEPTKLDFENIKLEKSLENIIPDVLIEKSGRLLCVEIFVSHKVDEQKINKMKEMDISAIEIDLSKTNRLINFELLKELIVDSTENKKWLFNSKLYNLQKSLLDNSTKRKLIRGFQGIIKGIENCPLPEKARQEIQVSRYDSLPNADPSYKCNHCKFLIKYDFDTKFIDDGFIHCIGHKTEEEINNLLNFKHGHKFNETPIS